MYMYEHKWRFFPISTIDKAPLRYFKNREKFAEIRKVEEMYDEDNIDYFKMIYNFMDTRTLCDIIYRFDGEMVKIKKKWCSFFRWLPAWIDKTKIKKHTLQINPISIETWLMTLHNFTELVKWLYRKEYVIVERKKRKRPNKRDIKCKTFYHMYQTMNDDLFDNEIFILISEWKVTLNDVIQHIETGESIFNSLS